jgi:acetone carboxylase gamma subunit
MRLSEYLQRTAAGTTQCTWCGNEVAPAGADWKDHAVVRRLPVERAGPHRVAAGDFFLIEACCPGCGTLLDTELAAGDDPYRHDRVHRWPEPEAGA